MFATDSNLFTNATLPDPQAIVYPARLVIVPDSMGVKEEVLSLPEQDRSLFLRQCNTTIDKIDKMGATEAWFMCCSHIGRASYDWQAEFRSKQIWQHPTLIVIVTTEPKLHGQSEDSVTNLLMSDNLHHNLL